MIRPYRCRTQSTNEEIECYYYPFPAHAGIDGLVARSPDLDDGCYDLASLVVRWETLGYRVRELTPRRAMRIDPTADAVYRLAENGWRQTVVVHALSVFTLDGRPTDWAAGYE